MLMRDVDDGDLTLTAQQYHHFMLTARAAWSKWCLGCDNIYLQMTSIVSCRSDIDSLLFLVSDDEITERSTSDHTVRSTWPAALCIYLLVLWLEDRLTRLLSRTKIDFPALNSTGYLTPFCETPWEEWLTLPLALFGNCVSVLWEYLQLDLARVSNVKSIY